MPKDHDAFKDVQAQWAVTTIGTKTYAKHSQPIPQC